MGFEEIAHTADWSVRVWANDLQGLFVEAAKAMNSLSGTAAGRAPRLKRIFESEAPDAEILLVSFLSELVYLQEQENVAFDRFELALQDQTLKVVMEGGPVERVDKAIKAVTYHNLKVERTEKGFETTIVFDV
jgi:SHS2 domain-containing protein